MTAENKHTLATLYGNCALIQLKKENLRTCLKDCNAALALEVCLVTPHLFDILQSQFINSRTIRRYYIARLKHWQDYANIRMLLISVIKCWKLIPRMCTPFVFERIVKNISRRWKRLTTRLLRRYECKLSLLPSSPSFSSLLSFSLVGTREGSIPPTCRESNERTPIPCT